MTRYGALLLLALGCASGGTANTPFETPEELFVAAEASYLTALDNAVRTCPEAARVRIDQAFSEGSEALVIGYAIERGDHVCDEAALPGCTQRRLVESAATLQRLADGLEHACDLFDAPIEWHDTQPGSVPDLRRDDAK